VPSRTDAFKAYMSLNDRVAALATSELLLAGFLERALNAARDYSQVVGNIDINKLVCVGLHPIFFLHHSLSQIPHYFIYIFRDVHVISFRYSLAAQLRR
jgi:hypothetical protein